MIITLAASLAHVPALAAAAATASNAASNISATQLSAIGGPNEVAIGICVAYLGFDRFRYHARARALISSVAKNIAAPKDLLDAARKDGLTQVERDILAALYHCGDEDTVALIEPHKAEVFDGDFMKTAPGVLMAQVLKYKIDRRIVQGLIAILCLWELYRAFVLYTHPEQLGWMGRHWVGWVTFGVVALAFLVPSVAFAISEFMMNGLKSATKRWARDEKTRQERAAAGAGIPGIAAPANAPGQQF